MRLTNRVITASNNTNHVISVVTCALRGVKHDVLIDKNMKKDVSGAFLSVSYVKNTKMNVSGVNLGDLPDVLQELVILFAFNLPKDEVLESLDVILSIVDMNLPFFFFRDAI